MEKTIGIIGGMGPKATNDLYNKIIDNTLANSDGDHPHVIIDSNTKIPDRTSFILKGGVSPSKALVRSALKLEYMGADFIIIPCNTAHYFVSEIEKYTNIPVINIINQTAKYCKKKRMNRTLLLATEGTYKTNIYKKAFMREGLEIVYPSGEEMNIVNREIYNLKSGFDVDTEAIKAIIDVYREQVSGVILGCTELPVIFKGLSIGIDQIDPTMVLAKAALDYSKH